MLRWLDESYGSKEPVEYGSLTIEHVLPQTLTTVWRQALAQDLTGEETADQVYESLVHTLGNLTLTGYNSALSNSEFTEKRQQLQKSTLAMNQQIARQATWGRPEIQARAEQLADRITRIWPGPVDVAPDVADIAWSTMDKALAEMPAGSWTTYGNVAALIGSHPVPVGVRLANHPVPNAHRVLQADGKISPSFRWLEPGRIDDPADLLRAEGVTFDEHDRADPAQRLSVEDLAQIAGMTIGDLPDAGPMPSSGQNPVLRDQFIEQLATQQGPDTVHSVLAILDTWTAAGGTLLYGYGGQTSCFLMARDKAHPDGSIWPVVIYPLRSCEVVFQHLAARPPFEDVQMRQELRERLNKIPGVDLPFAKIELRPAFPLKILADPAARDLFIDALKWFYDQANRVTDPPSMTMESQT